MHNNDSKTASISKSYTNSKKEELLKVINEAKQKLENVSINRSLELNVALFIIPLGGRLSFVVSQKVLHKLVESSQSNQVWKVAFRDMAIG